MVRDKPKDNEISPLHAPQTMQAFYKEVIGVIQHPGLWLNGIYAGLLFSVVTVFSALWAPLYLRLVQHAALPTVTFESSLLFIGIAIGSPVMGLLFAKIQDKNTFLMFTALLSAIIAGWIIYGTPTSVLVLSTLFFLLGIGCSSYIFNFSLVNLIVSKNVKTTSIGFTNALCVATTPLLQPLIGWILHMSAKNTQLGASRVIYTASNYHIALAVIPIGLLIAACMSVLIPKLSAE